MSDTTNVLQQYASQIRDIFDKFQTTQRTVLDATGEKIVEAYVNHKRFLVFGSGHSHMIAEEFYARAGGLGYVTPVLQNELTLSDHPMKSTLIERTQAMAKVYFDLYHFEAGDVLLIASNSGRNAMPIELAKMAKEAGLTVIAFTNLSQTLVSSSRHSAGKNLHAYADIVIDNCGAFGDAGFDIGEGIMMGSSSTFIGAFAAQAISILVAVKIKALGLDIPVFRSGNVDGADAYNAEMMKRFSKSL
ncbi:MAG: sugar isomerase domain-containing protein [Erysipelotrichales bacterium]|nr:MAG: sugar isomerase domain-containing protein [Erysipelotrichales bacterium]